MAYNFRIRRGFFLCGNQILTSAHNFLHFDGIKYLVGYSTVMSCWGTDLTDIKRGIGFKNVQIT
jgi:hypothetical protein